MSVDWSKLSPLARAALILMSQPILDGYTTNEAIAARIGKSPQWVMKALKMIRDDLHS